METFERVRHTKICIQNLTPNKGHPNVCTAVGDQQFCQEWRMLQTRIVFERYYYFFHYCLLSYRLMFQKCILCKPKWEAQAVVWGERLPLPPPPPPPPLRWHRANMKLTCFMQFLK